MLRRLVLPALLALWLALLLFVRLGDPLGDRGMSNALSAVLVLVLLLGVLARVLVSRRHGPRLRLGLAGGLALGLLLGAALLRYEGVSGQLVPDLRWRWEPERPAPAPPPERARGAELGAPGAADWPGFRGPMRDGVVRGVALARDWAERPPRLAWRVPIGAGWSSFALVGGWAFTLEQADDEQRVTARLQETGALVWSTALEDGFEHGLGGAGPRSTPAVHDGRVYALGAHGRLVCLDARDGALLWDHDLLAEHGTDRAGEEELVQYGRSCSPLVLGELVVVPAGGRGERQAGLVAFDARSGERRWTGPPRQISHASPVAATLGGVEQVLVVNEDSVSGHAPADGRLLWEHPWPGVTAASASVSQPVPVPPARVFLSKGYGGGAMLLELGPDLAPAVVWRDARIMRTKLTDVVLHDGHVYGLDDGILECVELATGRRRWKGGRHGHGQVLLVGDLLLVAAEYGEVLLVAPDPERENEVLGSFQGLEGKSWAQPAMAGARLFLRNAEEAAAWDLPER